MILIIGHMVIRRKVRSQRRKYRKSSKKKKNRTTHNNSTPSPLLMSNFTYECDFVIVEDTTSVIDHYLGGMVLGKPFVRESGLVYDKDEETVTFEKDKERIIFKMPHKMERFKHIDKEILKIDNIPPFTITDDDSDQEKTHYPDSLNLGPAYRQDESVTKAIQCLIKINSRIGKEGVM
ncbi:hypothetical protein Tco_1492349 [Tanacetum coccineum]